MRAFLTALLILGLLIGGVILLSEVGIRRLDSYLDALPHAEDPVAEEADLAALKERIEKELGLLNAILHHTQVDSLTAALARAVAAAESRDAVEYRILTGEVRQILTDMKRDLLPILSDIW